MEQRITTDITIFSQVSEHMNTPDVEYVMIPALKLLSL